MTTRVHTGVDAGAVREALKAAVDLPVIINLSSARVDGERVVCDMAVTESVSHNEFPQRQCEGPGCPEMFFPTTAVQKFHSNNCRLKAFRAEKKALEATE